MDLTSPAEINQKSLSTMHYAAETSASEAEQSSTKPLQFMDFPGEIRNNIYKLVLSSQHVPRHKTAPLLLVSKAVHQECKDFWFERRLVRLRIDIHGIIPHLVDRRSEFNDNKLVRPQLASTWMESLKRQKNFKITIAIHKSNEVAVGSIISRVAAATLAIATALEHRKDIDTIHIFTSNLQFCAKSTSCTQYASRIFDPLEKRVRNVKSVKISIHEPSLDPTTNSILASYAERVGKVMEGE